MSAIMPELRYESLYLGDALLTKVELISTILFKTSSGQTRAGAEGSSYKDRRVGRRSPVSSSVTVRSRLPYRPRRSASSTVSPVSRRSCRISS